jgi:hypothetical protein
MKTPRLFFLIALSVPVLAGGCPDDPIAGVSLPDGATDATSTMDSRPPTVGGLCDPGTVRVSQNQSVFNAAAPECPTGLCLWPGIDPGAARPITTGALCTAACNSDADCEGAVLGDPATTNDTHCKSGFACAIAFEVGPLCCKKLCVCRDFHPDGALPPPQSCLPDAGSSCLNL